MILVACVLHDVPHDEYGKFLKRLPFGGQYYIRYKK